MSDSAVMEPLQRLSDDALLDAVRAHEICRRKLETESHALVAEVAARGLPFAQGCRDVSALLQQLLRLSPGEAKARVSAARDLGPRRAVTGEELEPIFPAVAAAQAEGVISPAHARTVIAIVEKIPPQLRADHEDAVETHLVEAARQWAPREVDRIGQRVLAHLDPDGALENLGSRYDTRFLRPFRRADGSGGGTFAGDAEFMEVLCTVVDALGAPKPGPDGMTDPRSSGQRALDAVFEALQAGMRAGELPSHGGTAVTVLLRGTAEQWAAVTGMITTGTGVDIPTAEAKRWASGSDTRLLGVQIDAAGRPISYSSCQRLFTEQQRLVLAERDGGCTFPGCTAPAAYTQAHHILDWAKGGPTSVENGALLCRFHHRWFEQMGWSCALADGRVHWTPPAWLDPQRRPRVNTLHDRSP